MFKSIQNIGITEGVEFEEASKVRLLNNALALSSFFILSDVLSHLFQGYYLTSFYVSLSLVIVIFGIVLNYFGRYNISRVLIVVVTGFYFMLASYLFGDKIYLVPAYMVVSIFVVMMFETALPLMLSLIGYLLLCYTASKLWLENLGAPYSQDFVESRNDFIFLLCLALGVLLLIRILRQKRKYIDLTESLLKDVEEKNEVLAKQNQELESFAFATSHDLKTPLRNITSYIGLIKKKKDELDDPKVEEYLNIVEDGAHKMYACIDEILTLTSLDFDQSKWEKIDLNEIVNEIAFLFQNGEKGNKTKIIFNKLPVIKGNKNQINVLFQNLIENALKYNESDRPEVKISADASEGVTTLVFEDNGIGIDKEYEDLIYLPFKRLHGNNRYEGTGLGLAIVKKIVESHKAEIKFNSKLGSGSKFSIRFPN